MKGFSLDIEELKHGLTQSAPEKIVETVELNRVPYASNRSKFFKRAFDMFESKYDHSIWELSEEGGGSFLVKRTDLEAQTKQSVVENVDTVHKRAGIWGISSVQNGDVVLSLYDVPVRKFARAAFGFDENEAEEFAITVLEQMAASKSLVRKYVTASHNRAEIIAACRDNSNDSEARDICLWLSEK